MIEFGMKEFCAGLAGLPPAPPPVRVDPVTAIAKAMLELDAEGRTVDAYAIGERTRLTRSEILEHEEAARDRAHRMGRQA